MKSCKDKLCCSKVSKHNKKQKFLPCPHGRVPTKNSHGWQHCPHCLGINNQTILSPEDSKKFLESVEKGPTPEQLEKQKQLFKNPIT